MRSMAKIGWYISMGIHKAFANYLECIFREMTIFDGISILLKFKLGSIP